MKDLPITPRMRKVIVNANIIAQTHKHDVVDGSHLLLAILAEDEGAAIELIRECGISPNAFKKLANKAMKRRGHNQE